MTSLIALAKRLRGDNLAWRISRQQTTRLADLATRVDALEAQLRLLRISSAQGMAKLESQLQRLVEAYETRPAADPEPGTSDPGAWASEAQLGELSFHARNHSYRGNDTVWWSAVEADWLALGLDRRSWAGKTVLDVGAGSRLRTLWFEDVEIIVVEPLADRFLAEVPFCDLDRATEVHAVPGETYVRDLAGRADVVVSINALDHGYDMAASVSNIRRYLKPDGIALLSFDLHDTVSDHMHPMVVTHQMMLRHLRPGGIRGHQDR